MWTPWTPLWSMWSPHTDLAKGLSAKKIHVGPSGLHWIPAGIGGAV